MLRKRFLGLKLQEEIGPKEKVTVGLLPTDLSWSVAGMERSEPSLVPEWLKGAGGGGGATHHSQPPIHQGIFRLLLVTHQIFFKWFYLQMVKRLVSLKSWSVVASLVPLQRNVEPIDKVSKFLSCKRCREGSV